MDIRRFAQIFGAVYVLVGVLGFAVTGVDGFASSEGNALIIFDVNPLHNIVHLLVGVAFIAGSTRPDVARTLAFLVGGVYVVVGVLGLGLVGNDSLNVLALNHPDNLLHLASGAVALLFGATARKSVATA